MAPIALIALIAPIALIALMSKKNEAVARVGG